MARFSEIDDSNREVHTYLHPEDRCIFLYEYTSGKNFGFSTTNSLINNLKKSPTLVGTAQYGYKLGAINRCSLEIRAGLNAEWLTTATLIPVPGSKIAGDPEFDNRMELVCRGLGANVDVRNLVIQTHSTAANHVAAPGERATVQSLLGVYQIDEALTAPQPTYLAIVDDVLTAGTHFRAMKTVLGNRFPGVPIIGIFIARRVFAAPPADADFDIVDF